MANCCGGLKGTSLQVYDLSNDANTAHLERCPLHHLMFAFLRDTACLPVRAATTSSSCGQE